MAEVIPTTDPVAPVVPPVADELPPEIAELIGEGKKYRTAADALKSIPHAQTHISKLESELAAARDEITKATAMEDLLAEFQKQAGQPPVSPAPQVPGDAQAPTVDINAQVEAILARKQAEQVANANIGVVNQAFATAYGDTAAETFEKLAKDVGLTKDALASLAATSPEAVLKLAGLKKLAVVSKPSGSINTDGFAPAPQDLSARVPSGASTKQLVSAWKAAGEKVRQRNS